MRSYPIKASAAFIAALLLYFCAISQTNFTNGGGDQLWFNAANWDNGLPAPGNNATIPPGFSSTINLTANYNFNFNVSNSGSLTINPSAFSATNIGTFTNSGNLFVNSLLINDGVFNISFTGSMTNFATFRNMSMAIISNLGNITNGGMINNGTGATCINNGFIQNNGGKEIVNAGSFTNDASMDNYGTITNTSTNFLNNGLITNFSIIDNTGTIAISASGNINSGGSFFNHSTASLTNDGSFSSTNLLDNDGIISNNFNMITSNNFDNTNGSFTNNDTYTNNGGTVINGNTMINAGDFTNTGQLTNNNGDFTNASCANYINQPGGSTTNTGGGTYTNNGLAYQLGGSVFQITTNNGQVLTNIADDPTPVAQCVAPIVVVLNAGNTASITTAQIDNGSEAPYCPGVTLALNQTAFNCTDVGNNIVTLTVTDVYNNTATCTATVFITEPTPPVITCPVSMILQAEPYACGASPVLNITATDNCGTTIISQTDASGFSPGDEFPFGTTLVSFRAVDLSGNSDDCSFSITVNEYIPASQALSCDDLVHISLAGDCVGVISPQTILEGNYGCSDDFTVNINNSGSNIITSSHIGLTLSVTVTNNETGVSCWGNILIEDKLPPVMTCTDITISCSAPESAYPSPVVTDCSAYTLSFNDVLTEFPCNLPLTGIKYRTYVAVDASGNSSNCTQTIQFVSGDISDVIFPDDITISCDVNWLSDANGHPTPSIQTDAANGRPGSPTLNGFSVYPSQGSCRFDVAYTDQEFPICDGTYKIVRHWLLLDWCDNDIREMNQIIKIMDYTPPVITCPADATISTTTNTCLANYNLPQIVATDNCSSSIQITRVASQGNISNNGISLTDLPLGITTITLTATDGCDNSASCALTITVQDQITPTAICDELTQVAVENNGEAIVFAPTFDDGSNDNCGIDHFEVRRMESPCIPAGTSFGPSVTFTCCDVNDTIGVVLRVWDVNGNYNDCMVQTLIEDKIEPVITCPANIDIYCDEGYNIWDLEQFGQPEFFDNCSTDTTYIREWDLGQCHTGFLYRRWIVTDGGGLTDECAQKITVLHNSDFVVDFPEDITFTDCNLGDIQSPVISDDDCELVALQHEDLVFDIVSDACYKIVRTWTVINWCVYDANDPQLTAGGIVLNQNDNIIQDDGDGYIQYQQIIKILDEVPPVITSPCQDVTFEDYSNEDDNLNDTDPTTSCDGIVTLQITAEDACSGIAALEYHFSIYLDSDLNTLPLTGNSNQITEEFPYGTHFIKWEVEDGCGNISFCEYYFTIKDKKKPSVICHQGLAANLIAMDTDGDGAPDANMVTVWDTEVLQSWDDNCTANDQLKLRITKNIGTGFSPDTKSVTFDCTEQGMQAVELWVGDNAGNWDYCQTFIDIQDNSSLCGPQQAMAMISGELMTEENESVSDVTIQIEGDLNNTMYQFQTSADGIYSMAVPATDDYLVTAQRNDDFDNGVSTYDIVLITKHILGIQSLGSPYKLIAADVNNNAAITAMDLVEIRKLILGITYEFSNNTSWRFIDRGYTFPNPANPWQSDFPELIYLTNLVNEDELEADFVATKVGDVNNSVIANSTMLGEERNIAGTIVFNTDNKAVKAGETFEMSFRVSQSDIAGFQFTLGFNREMVELMDIRNDNGLMNSEHFGVFEDAITTSWNGEIDENSTVSDQTMFTIVFKARKNVETREILRIGSFRTIAEGYNKNGDLMDIALSYNDGSVTTANSFELYQNEPNPFSNGTVISFSLPESSATKLSIVDASGRVLWVTERIFNKGFNAVQIQQDIFPCEGIYFYMLENEQYTATKKMVLSK